MTIRFEKNKESQINRRDFLNGMLIGAGTQLVAPLIYPPQFNQDVHASNQEYYPPSLNGLRGSHNGSYENAHALAWTQKSNWGVVESLNDEEYDLIIVGAGISGLCAAYFYQEKYGKNTKILILDNHDDFGGHAKRNEFEINGELKLSYGGSQSLQNPLQFSPIVKKLLKDLNVDIKELGSSFDQEFYKKNNLNSQIIFLNYFFNFDQQKIKKKYFSKYWKNVPNFYKKNQYSSP